MPENRIPLFRDHAPHLTRQASIATRATLRDDRASSLMAARAGSDIIRFYVIVKRKFGKSGIGGG
ncbi:hypothetical protein D1614_24375, partial [Maribellus luteus]